MKRLLPSLLLLTVPALAVSQASRHEKDGDRPLVPIAAGYCTGSVAKDGTSLPLFPLLRFVVGTDGAVTDIEVKQSSGSSDLDVRSVACARKWRYSPAWKDGKPAKTKLSALAYWSDRSLPEDQSFQSPEPLPRSEALKRCLARYPQQAAEQHAEGRTDLLITVTADGAVTDAAVAKSSGNAALDRASLDCIALQSYRPAYFGDEKVPVRLALWVTWTFMPGMRTDKMPDGCLSYAPESPTNLADIKGETYVSFVIKNGIPSNLRITQSSGSEMLDQAAMRCVSNWRYSYATLDGKPQDMRAATMVNWKALDR